MLFAVENGMRSVKMGMLMQKCTVELPTGELQMKTKTKTERPKALQRMGGIFVRPTSILTLAHTRKAEQATRCGTFS
jgi:hypothetical protein